MIRYCSRQAGFTYSFILITVFSVSILAGVTAKVGSHYNNRAKESDLIFKGTQIRNGIRRYYHAAMPHRYPRSLTELTKDPRFIYRSHLRRLYRDPFAKYDVDPDQSWNLILNSQGEIIGVSSKYDKPAIKNTDFPRWMNIKLKNNLISSWQFVYNPQDELLDNLLMKKR